MVLSVLNIKKDFGILLNCVFFFFFSPLVPLSTLLVLFLSRHLYSVLCSPDAKLPRWGYLKPFIALSLDGVFRGCFARVFTSLLTLLLFTRFISFAYSENLMPAQPSFSSLFSVLVSQQAS